MGNTSTKHSSSSPPGSPSSPTQNNQHGHPSSSSSANASSPSSALFHSSTPHSSPFNTFTKPSLPSSPSSRNNANSSPGGGPTTPPKPPFLPPETLVDGGALFPLSNIYPNQPHDWDRWTTDRLISERRLAPFYRGLGEWDDDLEAKSDDGDEEEEGDGDGEEGVDREAETAVISGSEDEEDDGVEGREVGVEGKKGIDKGIDKGKAKVDLSSSVATITPTRAWEGKKTVVDELRKVRENTGIKAGGLEDLDKEAELYRHATECPICFLYYPSNLNTSRCCFQPICTECVVHIKRAEPTTTNLTSEPACCPYCVEDNFGVIYRPPPFGKRSGAGADKVLFGGGEVGGEEEGGATPNGRKKSVSHTSSQVVTVDQIHPDWEAKLEAVKAAAARRANRRIIFRQVGDRLIPVGISSGRSAMALAAAAAAAANSGNGSGSGEGGGLGSDGSGSVGRRGRRHQDNGAIDLEELMIMEAMRLSLIEQQDREKKEKEQKEKEEKAKSERERKEKEIQERTTREQRRRSHLSPTTTTSSMSPRPSTGDSGISSSSSSINTGSPMPMLGQPSTTSLSSQAPLLSSKFNNASTATFSAAGGGGGGLNGFSTRSINAGASEDDDSATTPGDEQEEPSYVPLGDGDDDDDDDDDDRDGEVAAGNSNKGKGKETFGGDNERTGGDGEEDGGVGPRTPPMDGGFSRFGRENGNGAGNGNRMYGGFKGKGRSDAFVVPERRSSVAD